MPKGGAKGSDSPRRPTRRAMGKPTGWKDELTSEFRRLIQEADPEAVEQQKWKKPSNPAGVPVWYHDGIVCHIVALKNRVRLTFLKGAQLDDANGLFNACLDGHSMRAIDIGEGGTIDVAGVKALVRAAVALNTSAAGARR
jgi:hypothetical protein